MKLACSATTLSGARRFASSGQRIRGTASERSAPMPPSATIGGPSLSRCSNRVGIAWTLCAAPRAPALKLSPANADEEPLLRSGTDGNHSTTWWSESGGASRRFSFPSVVVHDAAFHPARDGDDLPRHVAGQLVRREHD